MESKITSDNIFPPNLFSPKGVIVSWPLSCNITIKFFMTRITILITLLQISFFLNGHPAGVAFSDVYFGEYFPAISIYGRSTLRCNFGPTFKCPPKIEGRKFVSQA